MLPPRPNDVPRDEVRRALRDSQRAHDDAMPRFRRALDHLFDPTARRRSRSEAREVAAARSALVGVPSRRQALRIGGTTVLGAAVLAACADTDPPKVQLAQTGTVPSTSSTTVPPEQEYETNLTLLRTAQSIEALAIVAYELAGETGKLDPTVAEVATFFQDQHREHKAALIGGVRALDGQPYSNPDAGDPPAGITDSTLWAEVNPTLWAEVSPQLSGDLDQAAIVTLATELEDLAAQTYTVAAGVLSTEELRATIMSIGGVEARHVSVLLGVTNSQDVKAQAPFPFEGTANAAPEDSWVGPGELGSPPAEAPKGTGTSVKPPGTSVPGTGTTTAG